MRRANEMIGMDVSLNQTGRVIGCVQEVMVSRCRKRVAGFLLQRTNWWQKARVLPIAQVESMTLSEVFVPDERAIVSLDRLQEEAVRTKEKNEFVATPLFSSNGHPFGQIVDVCFSERSGDIEGFDVFTGSAFNALAGSLFLPWDDGIVVTKCGVVVGNEAAERLMFTATEIDRRVIARGISGARELSKKTVQSVVSNGTTEEGEFRDSWLTSSGRFDQKSEHIV
jgi:uncharacterized protein YrrD